MFALGQYVGSVFQLDMGALRHISGFAGTYFS
jgi:hypothetical protein